MNKSLPCALMLLMAWCTAGWAIPVEQREFDLVLKRTPDVKHGASLYETCAACHGPKGEGVSDGTVPMLAGQSFTVIAKQLVDFRAGQRGDPRMVHFSSSRHLAFSQHIADVSAYIASFPAPAKAMAKDEASRRGAAAYSRACARCHGATGEGKEDFLAPRLAFQHAEYLTRQLDDATEGRRQPMAETHGPLVRALGRDEVLAVTRYLAAVDQE